MPRPTTPILAMMLILALRFAAQNGMGEERFEGSASF
jgi:hypothetical protein